MTIPTIYRRTDRVNRFVSYFSPDTGRYVRTGVLDENGKDTGEDPFMASFPELIDIGVMGHCIHGRAGLCQASGVQCYQNGLHTAKPNMTVENFARIAQECKGKTFQFALGGRGDVDQHEHFEELLQICRENRIVPNFTSSGLGFDEHIAALCEKYCGAVAVSWYRSAYTLDAVRLLLEAGVKTNIHYVLGQNSIEEAAARLRGEADGFPDGINAVVFLLHKPVGQGTQENCLSMDDPRTADFFHAVEQTNTPYKIGFDSCSVPAVLHYTSSIDPDSIDTCEGGRFSMYITSDMQALPCSFDQAMHWRYDITNDTVQNAWNSAAFEDFRSRLRASCPDCPKRALCMGGCPICPGIVLCDAPCKTTVKGEIR